MFEKGTGAILIEEDSFHIGPQLRRDHFLASRLAETAKILVKNEPWCSYLLKPKRIGGVSFLVSLFFYEQTLQHVELVDAHDYNENENPWSSWSQEKEINRKTKHDTWLKSVLGHPPYQYDWGDVSSLYDLRSGGSSIIIRYMHKKQKSGEFRGHNTK